ncbi:Smr/MutS family protein [Gaopeijia maritima]|uniref:endonuclease MutS2 n=1 Tax=Gaopeijia maritima TaxID=3119007 RepID=UPI0032527AB1
MNRHALEVLDLQGALDRVSERAASTLGRARVRALRPSTRVDEVAAELDRVAHTMTFAADRPGWGPPAIPDPGSALARLKVEGSVLDPAEMHRVGDLLEASRVVAEALSDESGISLVVLRRRLPALTEVEAAIRRTVDAEGEVLDSASSDLRRIRTSLRSAHTRIVRLLERYVADLPDRFAVDDASVTVREGRYVIPLRREGRGHVGGVIHDESGTGATIFVEPPVAIDAMNDLRDLEREERREIQRILRTLTARLHPHAGELADALDALVDFDALHARARAALEWRADPPEVLASPSEGLRLVGARHPLLLAQGVEVVPYDLDLAPDEHTLVVTGPNTGGKSVFLKAVGLLALLAQSGVIPPVRRGTRLPVFTDVFADIGDEQSIAESLSTFSAHLERLRELVEEADAGSLVLIDEMGTGTDPTEGAALARAILETLTARGARTVVTSHLGALKTLDTEGSGVVNASLQFDPERIEPTYHFSKGRPGRSYGLAIAGRLGFPPALLARAQEFIDDGAASLDDLLERLELREREAGELVDRLRGRDEAVARREREVADRAAVLDEREKRAEREARDQARRLLMEAREEVESAIRDVRAAGAEAIDDAARSARRQVEEAARRQRDDAPDRAGAEGPIPDLAVGGRVRLPGGRSKGRLVELRDERAVVEVGGLRMEVAAAALQPIAEVEGARGGAAREERVLERGWSGEVPDAAMEIDLRGLRVDEVSLALGRGLDGAVLGGLSEVRVIHGKGTGAVRSRVQELLRDEPRVADFRLGVTGEGGAGVTVVRFR